MTDLGGGLAALAFWGFLASVVVAGIWYDVRRRESEQETLRRIVESGQNVDKELVDQILSASTSGDNLGRDLKVGGLITAFVAPGLAFLGWILEKATGSEAFYPLLGVAVLVGFVAAGLLTAAWAAGKRDAGSQY